MRVHVCDSDSISRPQSVLSLMIDVNTERSIADTTSRCLSSAGELFREKYLAVIAEEVPEVKSHMSVATATWATGTSTSQSLRTAASLRS